MEKLQILRQVHLARSLITTFDPSLKITNPERAQETFSKIEHVLQNLPKENISAEQRLSIQRALAQKYIYPEAIVALCGEETQHFAQMFSQVLSPLQRNWLCGYLVPQMISGQIDRSWIFIDNQNIQISNINQKIEYLRCRIMMLSKFWVVFLGLTLPSNKQLGSQHQSTQREEHVYYLLQLIINELNQSLRLFLMASPTINEFWDANLMTQALTVNLFSQNQGAPAPTNAQQSNIPSQVQANEPMQQAHLIVQDPQIFSHLVKLYLNLLMFIQSQSLSKEHLNTIRQQLGFIFKTEDQRDLDIFQEAVLQGKLSRKFTFNFIRQFTSTSNQQATFTELNLRKCLTVRVVCSPTGESQSLLQVIGDRVDLQAEQFLILVRFALDPEGGSNGEVWCQKFWRFVKEVTCPRQFYDIAQAFIEGVEFRGGHFNNVRTEQLMLQECNSQEYGINLLIYICLRDSRLLGLRASLESSNNSSGYVAEQQSKFKGQTIEFLFKLCQQEMEVDLVMALAQLSEANPDVYLVINKCAKELGIKKTNLLTQQHLLDSHNGYQGQNTSLPHQQAPSKQEYSQESIIELILTDLPKFDKILYSADFSTKKLGGQQGFVRITLESIQSEVGKLEQNKKQNVRTTSNNVYNQQMQFGSEIRVAKLYLLEQSFLEQVRLLGNAMSSSGQNSNGDLNMQQSDDLGNLLPTLQFLKAFQTVDIKRLVDTKQSLNLKLAWLHCLIVMFDNEVMQILKSKSTTDSNQSNPSNPTQSNSSTSELHLARAKTLVQNLKCLLIQLLLEVLCLCQSQFEWNQSPKPTGGPNNTNNNINNDSNDVVMKESKEPKPLEKSTSIPAVGLIADKLQIDYAQFTFAGSWLSKRGFQFEQETLQLIHAILVEEPTVIDQLHRQTYPLEIVSLVVNEVKSIQFALNFLPSYIRADFDHLTATSAVPQQSTGHHHHQSPILQVQNSSQTPNFTYKVSRQNLHALQTLYLLVFHMKVLVNLVEVFPLKEQCAQIDELLDYFMSAFSPQNGAQIDTSADVDMNSDGGGTGQGEMSGNRNGAGARKMEVGDEYLLREWIDCFAKICSTFPFLKSKTCQLISTAFVETEVTLNFVKTLQY